jgi:Ca2+-binding RTX toxin-like protein
MRSRTLLMMFESLQPRRLLSYDLYHHDATLDGVVAPSSAALVTVPIANAGTQLVNQSFFVEGKLVKTDTMFGAVNTDFYDPDAIVLFKTQIDFDIPVGPAGYDFFTTVNFPAELSPGRYSIVVGIDTSLEVNETNESNNYVAFLPTRIMPEDKNLTIEGTAGNDYFLIAQSQTASGAPRYSLTFGGETEVFRPEDISGFDVHALDGNDTIVAGGNIPNLRVDGGGGNDKIVGGELGDFLVGGSGKDQIDGRGGNDRLNGNGGNDKLFGGLGADRIYGYAGADYLDGGSSGDRLDGGAGVDNIFGQSGIDRFFTADNEIDTLFGGSGRDVAEMDFNDRRSSVEEQNIPAV